MDQRIAALLTTIFWWQMMLGLCQSHRKLDRTAAFGFSIGMTAITVTRMRDATVQESTDFAVGSIEFDTRIPRFRKCSTWQRSPATNLSTGYGVRTFISASKHNAC